MIRAKEAGILTTERVVAWLENELERQYRARRLFATIDKLQAIEHTLTQTEIDEEIRAYRAEKQLQRVSRTGEKLT